MAEENYHSLSSLQVSGNIKWKIRVRVSRIWRIEHHHNGNVAGLNLILIDNLGDRIHAWIKEDLIGKLGNEFREGATMQIKYFKVQKYREEAKNICFEASQFIKLTETTRVMAIQVLPNFIPNNVFVFTHLGDVSVCANQDRYLIDVIGIVRALQPIRRFTFSENEHISFTKFVLSDTYFEKKVVLYDALSDAFQLAIQEPIEQHPIIVIISSCKVIRINDLTGIISVPATRFYINLIHEATNNLRNEIRFRELI